MPRDAFSVRLVVLLASAATVFALAAGPVEANIVNGDFANYGALMPGPNYMYNPFPGWNESWLPFTGFGAGSMVSATSSSLASQGQSSVALNASIFQSQGSWGPGSFTISQTFSAAFGESLSFDYDASYMSTTVPPPPAGDSPGGADAEFKASLTGASYSQSWYTSAMLPAGQTSSLPRSRWPAHTLSSSARTSTFPRRTASTQTTAITRRIPRQTSTTCSSCPSRPPSPSCWPPGACLLAFAWQERWVGPARSTTA